MKGKERWTPELLQRMYEEATPAMRTILGYLAARPDEWVPYGELNAAISSEDDRNVGKLGSTLSWLTNRYGTEWPFDGRPAPTAGEGVRYRMDAPIAERIRAYDAARAPRSNGS